MPSATTASRTSSEPRLLLSIDDVGIDEVRRLLDRARQLSAADPRQHPRRPFSTALLFLAESLRTRVGFAAAIARLGGTPIDVGEMRSAAGMSGTESFADTLRTVSGMVDLVVARTPFAIARATIQRAVAAPYVNAGDDTEHPTQALIDLLAIEQERGPIHDLALGLCGDLGMRVPRSLIKLLNRVTPRTLRLIAPPGRGSTVALSQQLASRTVVLEEADFRGLDVLYMAGLPEGGGDERLDAERRAPFSLDERRLRMLDPDAVILSPMPLIDEIGEAVRADPRFRAFAQSDRGVLLRMALLERLLER